MSPFFPKSRARRSFLPKADHFARIKAWLALVAMVCAASAGKADAAAPGVGAGDVPGMELVMVEEAGCAYCVWWMRDVGQGYGKSEEGRLAPLRRIEIDSAEARQFPRIVYTPTFLLLSGGKEVGRILGYSGPDLFWWQLTDLVRKHGQQAKPTSGSVGTVPCVRPASC
jgi:hypothetical protein